MKQLANIKEVFFDNAHYQLSDGSSDTVTLQIDYKNNTYQIQPLGAARANAIFRKEIAKFASDLLARKRGVNFARHAHK